MAKVIDLTNTDGDLVVLGRALVLPNSITDSQPHPLNGSIRFNPAIGAAQLFHAGAWSTLGGDTINPGTGGDGTSNNHTHTIAQIIGLQNILNGKAPVIHTHAIGEITGLTVALSNKSDVGHSHTIGNISGLRSELDNKAPLAHNHMIAVQEVISGCFPASPIANYKLVYTAGVKVSFPANFVNSFVRVGTPPAAIYTISLLKNGITNVGSLVFSPDGLVTKNLSGGLILAAGDTLTFQCPARDTAINTISFSLVGTRDFQTVA